jgi:hypothetical protein
MDKNGFIKFLEKRELTEEQIADFIALCERFEAFVGGPQAVEQTTTAQVNAFSKLLIDESSNQFENYRALALYGRFIGNNTIYVGVVELVDGAEALDNLYERVGELAGEAKRDQVFEGIDLPPYGSPTAEKPSVTQAVMEGLNKKLDEETCQEIFANTLRYLEDEWFLDSREKYQACQDFDEFLKKKGDEFLAELEKIKEEGGLFFTQEITQEVLDYVRSHPEIYQGVREGDILYEVKIPYKTKEFLAESDPELKRYYYCHCPWVRESLLTEDVEINPDFCKCSAGFHKKPWEVIFDQHLEAEVVESVLKGDPWCKFAIHLPKEVLSSKL